MPNTSRMGYPYPSEDKDPWYDQIVAFFNAVDAATYAERENRNVVLMDGGLVSWNSVSGVLQWAEHINLNASISGLLWVLQAGNVTLQDGDLLYVDLSRYPTANQTVTAQVASQAPSTNAALMLAIRKGTRVYWRDGKVLNNGDSKTLFITSSGVPSLPPQRIPIALNEVVDGVVKQMAAGPVGFDPTVYPGATVKLEVVLSVSDIARTGTVKLLNTSVPEFVTSSTLTTSLTSPTVLSATLALGNGAGEMKLSQQVYELWIYNDGAVAGDQTRLGSAHLVIEV